MSQKNSTDPWDYLVSGGLPREASTDFVGGYLTASEREAAEDRQIVEAAVESRIAGRSLDEGSFRSMRGLVGSGLDLPVEAGTRVSFSASASAVLGYDDPPAPNAGGTVVAVRSASGDITSHDGVVFVRWDDGATRAVHAQHLRVGGPPQRGRSAVASGRIRVASLGDLTDFMKLGGDSDTLVHKATRDLWSVKRDGSGFVIERLFDGEGAPLRV